MHILVVRVFRGYGHNSDYDLGNPRAASAVLTSQTSPDIIQLYCAHAALFAACASLIHGEAMSIPTVVKNCLHALAAWAARARNAITRTLSSTKQQTEKSMTDPQTNTTDPNAQGTGSGTNTAGTNTGSTDPNASGQNAGTGTTATLEQVVQSYESALTDFNAKLAAYTAAQSALTASAQAVSGFKQQLDALGQQEDSKFDAVKPYLPTT